MNEANQNTKPKLMLLFTRGASLQIWDAVGMFDREVELYKRLLPHLSGISFLTYANQSDLRYEQMLGGIEIIPNSRGLTPTRFSILAPLMLRKQFREADIIKTNQLDGAWTGVIAKLLFRKKLIVRCGYLWSVFERKRLGDGIKARWAFLLEKICMKSADMCVVATLRDAEYIKKTHHIDESKVRVFPNYVDIDVFRPMPEIKREAGLICFVGRLWPQKNVEALLEACRGLDGVRLLLIGDGVLRDSLKQMALAFNLDVEFLQSVPNAKLPHYLNRAQTFVLPSHYEGCPKALLEAMACELPVIGTDVDGIRDMIRHGENGILCEKSVTSIRSAILNILNDTVTARRIAAKAREYVEERHSLNRIVEMELETIRGLLKSPSIRGGMRRI